MSLHYRAFGLHVAASASIPGLQRAEPRRAVDVHIDLEERAAVSRPPGREELLYASFSDSTGDRLRVWRDGCGFRFHYSDGAEFFVNGSGTRIQASWAPPLSLEDMATYLLGPILGFVLRRRGVVCLHAATIAIGDEAIVLVGPGGAGKSTVAAAFVRSGFDVLHDDIAAIVEHGDRFWVLPGHPRLRLWPASVGTLYGSPDALPRISPDHPAWDKRYLDLQHDPPRFCSSPIPLSVVYLGRPSPRGKEPKVSALPRSEGLLRLVANSYGGRLLDAEQRAHEFDVLGRLASQLPLREIQCGDGLSALVRLFSTVLEDARRIFSDTALHRQQVPDGSLSQ